MNCKGLYQRKSSSDRRAKEVMSVQKLSVVVESFFYLERVVKAETGAGCLVQCMAVTRFGKTHKSARLGRIRLVSFLALTIRFGNSRFQGRSSRFGVRWPARVYLLGLFAPSVYKWRRAASGRLICRLGRRGGHARIG